MDSTRHDSAESRVLQNHMLETIVAVLLILWLLGFSFKVGGNLIHTLLVIALVVFIVRLL